MQATPGEADTDPSLMTEPPSRLTRRGRDRVCGAAIMPTTPGAPAAPLEEMDPPEVGAMCHPSTGGGPTVRIRLLGGFGVDHDSRAVDARAWRLRKARTLVKL